MRPESLSAARVTTLAALALLVLAAAPAVAAPPYGEELAVMQTTIDSFNACADRIENATTAEEMIPALAFAADELERVFPDMITVTRKHPDWGRNPPPEIKPTMDSFDKAYDRFLVNALNKATKVANGNTDNAALQKAFGRVNRVLYQH